MIDLDSMSDDDKLAALESIHKSIAESKEVQKQKIAANVNLVLQALKKMESDIRARYDETGKAIEKRVANIKDGKDGRNGVDGKAGRDGRSGADGATGPRGADGLNGRDGRDGEDGVSVTDAHIDFDGSLIIHLSTGRVINVGEVVAPDLVERIKVITNGGGTSQQVLDTLVSLQNQINAITTGVTYQGTWNASTNTPTLTSSAGTTNGFYIVSVAGSTTLNGTSNWGVGDWAIFNGSIWQRVEGGSSGNFVDLSASGTVTLSGLTASTALALDASKNIVSVTNTGTGNNVLATSPTLVTPVLGTPTSGDFSTGTFTWPTFNQNTTGTASNVTGTVAVANGGTGVTSSTGTTNVVLSNSPVLVTPDLGTPSALVGTNITGTATAFTASNVTTNANLTGAVTSIGNTTSLGSFTSAQLLGALTDETGTGAAVFATSPTLITPALGTPASGVVTNLTGTASININGTVGATTANTGAFTTLTTSSTVTHNGGTANGVTYLNGSKVLTSGSALVFDGTTTLTAPSFQATTTTTSLVRNVNNSFLGIAGGTSYSNGAALLLTGSTNADVSVAFLDANSSVFRSAQGGTEYMRLTTTGLGIGTSSPTQKITANGSIRLTGNSGNFNETGAQMDSYDGLRLASYISTGSAIQFLTNASGGNTAERARIDSSGNLLVGKTSNDNNPGISLRPTGEGYFVRSGADVLSVNRLSSDGQLVVFYQDTVAEGNISVSGTTVSYNGGHLSRYAQTTTAKDDSIVKGTVLSNLDEMNVYTKDGQPVDNEQLNKVKVSDTEGDVNVAGVFVNWGHDDAHNVDEINMAMTGDMIIRIAQGTTVQRGDLLMSAGDGTAKPQGDDIVRSKTVAKVTSNHITCTYADGSYCVPCVLMAC